MDLDMLALLLVLMKILMLSVAPHNPELEFVTGKAANLLTTGKGSLEEPLRNPEIGIQKIMDQDKLKSSHGDFEELSRFQLELAHTLWSEIALQASMFDPSQWDFATEFLEDFHKTLFFFKDLKLLELGELNSPTFQTDLLTLLTSTSRLDSTLKEPLTNIYVDVVDVIAQRAWENFGNSVVNTLEELIINNEDISGFCFLAERRLRFIWWRYIFKSTDFLLRNHYVSQEAVIDFFRHPLMLKQMLCYIEAFLHNVPGTKHYITVGSYRFTEHWYLSLVVHDSFKALGREVENVVNAYFLLVFRYRGEISRIHTSYLEHLGLNLIQKYMWFSAKDFLAAWHQDSKNSFTPDLLVEDVRRIIGHVATSDNKILDFDLKDMRVRGITDYLCDVLDLIENHLSPRIIEKQLLHHPDSEEFDNRFKLPRCSAKMRALHYMINQFYEYAQKKSPNDWFKSIRYKSTFDSHFNQFAQVFHPYQTEFKRVSQKPNYSSASSFHSTVQKTFSDFEQAIIKIQEKSNTFSC